MGSGEVLIFIGSNEADYDHGRTSSLPVETVRANLADFVQSLQSMLPSVSGIEGLPLKAIQVAAGVNGKGQVGFLGIGGELGGSATLTLTFEVKANTP